MSKWINTRTRLPSEREHGLCAMRSYDSESNPMIVVPFTFMDGAFHPYADDDSLETDDYWVDPLHWPTHWMPLPPPPGTPC